MGTVGLPQMYLKYADSGLASNVFEICLPQIMQRRLLSRHFQIIVAIIFKTFLALLSKHLLAIIFKILLALFSKQLLAIIFKTLLALILHTIRHTRL